MAAFPPALHQSQSHFGVCCAKPLTLTTFILPSITGRAVKVREFDRRFDERWLHLGLRTAYYERGCQSNVIRSSLNRSNLLSP